MSRSANTKTIAKAAVLVMTFFALSRFLGVLRDVVIASQFGASAPYDAYLAAFRAPDLLFNLISGGALGSAFIPTFTGCLSRDDETGAWRLASAIINWVLVIAIGVGVLAAIFAPWLVENLIAPGFEDAAQINLTVQLMRWLLFSTVIFGVSGVLMGILNARQHFLLPALAPVVYNLSIIAGAWFLGPIWGVKGLAFGVVMGSLGHLLIQVPKVFAYGLNYQFILAPGDPGVREVARLMAPRVIGIAAIQLNFVWDTFLASWLTEGSIATLDYGRRVMLLPVGIVSQAVATAAFPTFAALAAKRSWDELQDAFIATLRSILYLTVPATIGLVMLGRPIIQALYQRNAFTEVSTQNTVWALWFYSIGLVAHSMVEILTRAFYSLHNTRAPVIVGVISMGVNILLSLLLMQVFAGLNLAPHGGIALASAIAIIIEMVWLMLVLKRLPGKLSVRALKDALPPILFSGLAMAAVLGAFLFAFGDSNAWLTASGGIVVGGIVYVLVSYALGAAEPGMLLRQVRQRLKRN